MLLIKTKIGVSKIHGIGLFADQFIPKGTITWRYNPEFDSSFSEDQLSRMSEPSRKQFMSYAYWDKETSKFILCFDDQRFINHDSKDPNILSTPEEDTAARDISAGEELICDYSQYEKDWFKRRGIREELFK